MLKSTQLPPTVASLLPLSPPSRHPQFTYGAEMLIHKRDSACNINGTPYQEQKSQLPHGFIHILYFQLDFTRSAAD